MHCWMIAEVMSREHKTCGEDEEVKDVTGVGAVGLHPRCQHPTAQGPRQTHAEASCVTGLLDTAASFEPSHNNNTTFDSLASVRSLLSFQRTIAGRRLFETLKTRLARNESELVNDPLW